MSDEANKHGIDGAILELMKLDFTSPADIQAAYEILDRLMTLAYASGRADEAESRSLGVSGSL